MKTTIEIVLAVLLGLSISTAMAYKVRRDCEEKMTKKGPVETCKTVLIKDKNDKK